MASFLRRLGVAADLITSNTPDNNASDSLTLTGQDSDWEYIDKAGNTIIPPETVSANLITSGPLDPNSPNMETSKAESTGSPSPPSRAGSPTTDDGTFSDLFAAAENEDLMRDMPPSAKSESSEPKPAEPKHTAPEHTELKNVDSQPSNQGLLSDDKSDNKVKDAPVSMADWAVREIELHPAYEQDEGGLFWDHLDEFFWFHQKHPETYTDLEWLALVECLCTRYDDCAELRKEWLDLHIKVNQEHSGK
ncbi:hypothetical protein H2200_009678 [Cladophialophora chaetospira]|uniref:Uncharacterized protein n=1 Tax=Cladophialophora chaetospira TaxID=386627 RepID=A0AA38X2Z1_9EURO|nr:hypothetical protein H2200_009678 [Cladophialophora chaetospira]